MKRQLKERYIKLTYDSKGELLMMVSMNIPEGVRRKVWARIGKLTLKTVAPKTRRKSDGKR